MTLPNDSLEEYNKKRNFTKTKEPKGIKELSEGDQPIFVIQKHDASNLHYDLRMEINSVLKSWAVPKGPSMDPKVKRLAITTEDHPVAYANFEGRIPEGEYGAGLVIIWDRGTYDNLKEEEEGEEEQEEKKPISMEEAYEEGHITIRLNGQKVKGNFALIRTGKEKNKRWLLIKMKDQEANSETNLVDNSPESVVSGLTLEELEVEMKEKEEE
ncbi:MAG: DNA ligase [Candidatus Heimdallarchaeota archaeon]|nr:DNA ligase [Candidatus Heimdallarchaeota archaeon]